MQQVNLSITTHCNRHCPLCCVRAGRPEHYPWAYFVEAARWFHGIPVVHLTGGEPTTHPEFERIAAEFRNLFGCRKLTVWTNGYGWPKYRDVFSLFDWVHLSHYTASTYPGSEPNTSVVQAMAARLGGKLRMEDGLMHIPMQRTGRTGACGRLRRDVVTYVGGLAYPCCVGPGPQSARGIPLTDTWETDLTQMAPPCDTCGFAV